MNSIRTPNQKNTELVNEYIPKGEVLLIDEKGEKRGILSTEKALEYAQKVELDLVVVAPDAKPMVAKVIDYSKFKYDQQKRIREAKKNQRIVLLKEVRLSPTIQQNDINTKLKNAIKFLKQGDKVKVSILFRGRMITHKAIGEKIINQFLQDLSEISTIESKTKMDGRNMFAIVAPIKEEGRK